MSLSLPLWVIKLFETPLSLPITMVSVYQTPSALSQDKFQAQEQLPHTKHICCDSLSFVEGVTVLSSQQGQKGIAPEHGSCLL